MFSYNSYMVDHLFATSGETSVTVFNSFGTLMTVILISLFVKKFLFYKKSLYFSKYLHFWAELRLLGKSLKNLAIGNSWTHFDAIYMIKNARNNCQNYSDKITSLEPGTHFVESWSRAAAWLTVFLSGFSKLCAIIWSIYQFDSRLARRYPRRPYRKSWQEIRLWYSALCHFKSGRA